MTYLSFDNLLEDAMKIIIIKLKPYIIYLFGSGSRNELREDSDIDIAFLCDTKISSYEVFMLAQEIANIFNRDVDLINLKEASTVFKVQVIGKGKKVYCNNENRRMEFEIRALKEYALLNEEREVIMKKIQQRGNVYGQ